MIRLYKDGVVLLDGTPVLIVWCFLTFCCAYGALRLVEDIIRAVS